jgi:hypothetical protein
MTRLVAAAVLTCSLSACTATPVKPGGFQGEYDNPLDVVKQAGIDAMTVNGFEITQTTDVYIEGHRPRTWGFFCTPGGEGAGIWLEQTSPSHIRVSINSQKSSFGMACQKEWTGPIRMEMEKTLGQAK